MIAKHKKTIVVIGNGMVGHRFCEQLVEQDVRQQYKIITFCEEARAAYDRVGLTSFFAHRDAEKLMLARLEWYQEHQIDIHIGDCANKIDRRRRVVHSEKGRQIGYDHIILATGSYPFVPPVEGIQQRGVFVYRTIADLEQIIRYAENVRCCAVIGGGLLGLEAAKAAYDLGLETHVVEFASRLMPRQIDDDGSRILVEKIEALGVQVHLNKATKEITGAGEVNGMVFEDGMQLDVGMIIVSAGIRPRDELARACDLVVGDRGGVQVNDFLQTSDPDIYAIGEVAMHDGMVYGLVAPGWEMAEIVAQHLTGGDGRFAGTDLSTKLKLLGIDVASFGDHDADSREMAAPKTGLENTARDGVRALVYEDPFAGVYKKLLVNSTGDRLLGGILIGDASDYGTLSALANGGQTLPVTPGQLMGTGGAAALGAGSLDDDAQVCSCNQVSKGQICEAIRASDLTTLDDVKRATRACAGCGGCQPLVADLLADELTVAGKVVNRNLCEHFSYSRQELFDLVRVERLKTFDALIQRHGQGLGCEICKPTVASLLASIWNDDITSPEHLTLQDTNDRFLANIQRSGSYSVVPRIPAGEVTPDQLILLGNIAKEHGLYTKITGGQRIDMFGAQSQQLPDIWEKLVDAGFESGHAYGKSVRTVKSCVGTNWCRYGVQDSVGLAIQLEKRYRGIRAPHKLKFAVSGCTRECAEAQSKDVGLVATEHGYNLYVGGNGGANPRHADLFLTDIDTDTAIRTIDRFLIYYMRTADKLNRTATWLEKMEGGLNHLKEVLLEDKLGICDELDKQMGYLVDSYRCEWREVVKDPERRKWFRQFVNSEDTETGIEIVTERGQQRPADWPRDGVPLAQITLPDGSRLDENSSLNEQLPSSRQWTEVGKVEDFPPDGGAAIKYGDVQIAVFNFTSHGKWYACQNRCPHKNAFVLSRGILGSRDKMPKIACPLHKRTYSLETGKSLSGEEQASVAVFPVKIEEGIVYLELPSTELLNSVLATHLYEITASDQSNTCRQCTSRQDLQPGDQAVMAGS